MVKITIFGVVIMCFVAGMAGICYAAPIGPMEPLGPMKCSVTVEYNSIFDKELETSGDTTGAVIERSNQFYSKLALGITDYLNIYAKLGTANLKQRVDWNVGRSQTIKYEYGFLWGVGGNGLYKFENNFGLGADMQFNMWFTDVDSIAGLNNPVLVDKGSLKNYEFQTAAYLTYTYDMDIDVKFMPYIGGYFSYFKSKIDKSISFHDGTYIYTLGDKEGDDSFGPVLGMNMSYMDNFSVNVEGRFIAETAATLGVNYKF